MLSSKKVEKIYFVEKGVFGKKFKIEALRGVDFSVGKGEILGLVGESGSGKTTLGKILAGIEEPTKGEVYLDGKKIKDYKRIEIAHRVSMIFQDPYSSFNPKLKIGFQLNEIFSLRKKIEKNFHLDIENIEELLELVSISSRVCSFYPYQLSGGELQRIAIARALIFEPEYLIADEPTSSLDLSVQSSIIELLLKLNEEREIGILFISHDLNLVESLTEKIFLMKDGILLKEGGKYYQKLKESTISL